MRGLEQHRDDWRGRPYRGERLELDHGRGLFLMRALMDHVLYRKGGCEVALYKNFRDNGR